MVPAALPSGPVFWRATGTKSDKVNSEPGAVWSLAIPNRSAAVSAAIGTRADFDGDGYVDLVLPERVIRGGRNGYEGALPLPAAPTDALWSVLVAVGDVNGDGFGDLLRVDLFAGITSFGHIATTPLFGGQDGFVAGPAVVPASGFVVYGALYGAGPVGDVNGDGYADVLLKTRFVKATYYGGASGLVEGTAPDAATSQSFFGFDGDVNGDGFGDAASTSNGVPNIVETFGSPTGFGAVPRELSLAMSPRVGDLAMLDANGDGYSDLAVTLGDGSLALFAGAADGLGAVPFQTLPAPEQTDPNLLVVSSPLGAWDFNGDGWSDLVTLDHGYAIHYGRAGGVDPEGTPLALPSGTVLASRQGDVDGDGFDDLTVLTFEDDPTTFRRTFTSALLYLGRPGGIGSTPDQTLPLR